MKMMEAGSGGGRGGWPLEFLEEAVPAHQKSPEPGAGDPGTSRRVMAFANNGFPGPKTGLMEGEALFSSPRDQEKRASHYIFPNLIWSSMYLQPTHHVHS